jgi:hypothetical protein
MFVRFEQCERFLRFRLAERAGQKFMEEYDVAPQRITPLLSLSGHEFEGGARRPSAATSAPPTTPPERPRPTTGLTITRRSSRKPASLSPAQPFTGRQ